MKKVFGKIKDTVDWFYDNRLWIYGTVVSCRILYWINSKMLNDHQY